MVCRVPKRNPSATSRTNQIKPLTNPTPGPHPISHSLSSLLLQRSLFPHLILRLRHPHQQILILNRNPRRQHLHRILEVRVEQNLPRRINQRSRRRMQHIQVAAIRKAGRIRIRTCARHFRHSAQQHKHVPDTKLGGEGERIVEEREVPPRSVCG